MEILYPMFGMIALSCFVVILLYATRVPPLIKMWGNLQHTAYPLILNMHGSEGYRDVLLIDFSPQ